MQSWLITLMGVTLLLFGVGETFMAVLYPRAINGPITATINRLFQYLRRANLLGHNLRAVAAAPLLIVTQVLCWAMLQLFGVSLIVWVQLGTGITSTGSEPTATDFASAVYYAGFTLTTLGVGDFAPRTSAMQVLTITAAGLGFSFFTLVLAYVISVYSTLARRNQFANEIDFRTERSGDSKGYLRAYLTAGDPSLVNQDLYALSSNLAELLESHHLYPILHHFQFTEPRYAMSRMLRFCLEVASMMRATREVNSDALAANPEAVDRLWHAALQMLDETKRHFVICEPTQVNPDPRLATELSSLLGGPADTARQLEAAYVDQQSKWLNDLYALAVCAGDDQWPQERRLYN